MTDRICNMRSALATPNDGIMIGVVYRGNAEESLSGLTGAGESAKSATEGWR